jgi:hypothetical protein
LQDDFRLRIAQTHRRDRLCPARRRTAGAPDLLLNLNLNLNLDLLLLNLSLNLNLDLP